MDVVTNTEGGLWIFGYGSLIWRPGFEFAESRIARVDGYRRNFCQASHDHRGTPAKPGRVLTLVPESDTSCEGMAFKLEDSVLEVLNLLDIREQDGYERESLKLIFKDGSTGEGLTWIAAEGNPSWRGGETVEKVAQLISEREGPSGSNRDYLFELERALEALVIDDAYIRDLCFKVRSFI